MDTLSSSVKSIEQHVKTLTTIVIEQSKRQDEINSRLTQMLAFSQSTPTSCHKRTTDAAQPKITPPSSRLSKQKSCPVDEDPDYTPAILLSDSSDNEAFGRRKRKKRSLPKVAKPNTISPVTNRKLTVNIYSK